VTSATEDFFDLCTRLGATPADLDRTARLISRIRRPGWNRSGENPGRGQRPDCNAGNIMSLASNNHEPGDDGRYNQPDDEFDLIVGALLKCAKGKWSQDDVEIAVGPGGVKVKILMPTARHGNVVWDKSGDKARPIVSNLRRYADCDPPRARLPEGVNPYTIFQCQIEGKLATFASSSWSAKKSFKRDVVDDWRYMHPHEFPIVTLGSRPSGDENDNLAPTFTVIKWVPGGKSGGMLADAPEKPALSGPASATSITDAPARIGRLLEVSSGPAPSPPPEPYDGPGEDDIPF